MTLEEQTRCSGYFDGGMMTMHCRSGEGCELEGCPARGKPRYTESPEAFAARRIREEDE